MRGSAPLADPRALGTGAPPAIARAIAFQLADEGVEVIVHGRDALRGAEPVRAIEARGGRARFVAADLSDSTEVRRLAEEASDIDILVNNAGFSVFGDTAGLDAEKFEDRK